MLGALLASSVLELRSQPGSSDGLESHHHRLAEAQAIASGVLAGANMLLLFILRKLALTISAVERAKLNEKFLVKQSVSLRAEYNRLHEDKDPKQGAGLGEAAKLRAALEEQQGVNSDLQVLSQGCVSKPRQWSYTTCALCCTISRCLFVAQACSIPPCHPQNPGCLAPLPCSTSACVAAFVHMVAAVAKSVSCACRASFQRRKRRGTQRLPTLMPFSLRRRSAQPMYQCPYATWRSSRAWQVMTYSTIAC